MDLIADDDPPTITELTTLQEADQPLIFAFETTTPWLTCWSSLSMDMRTPSRYPCTRNRRGKDSVENSSTLRRHRPNSTTWPV